MQQYSIYQTTSELLLKTLILLVEKCYNNTLKTVILAPDSEQQELLNKNLWTYARKQFIAHGSKLDPSPEKQPIYITDEMQNPNNSNILVIMPPFDIGQILNNKEYITTFQRIIVIHESLEGLSEITEKINQLVSTEKKIDCYKQSQTGTWLQVNNF